MNQSISKIFVVGLSLIAIIAIPATVSLVQSPQDIGSTAQGSTSINTHRGIIVSVDSKTLRLRVEDKIETLPLEKTADVQYVSSGDFDNGDEQITATTINYLRPDQEALVTIKENTYRVIKVVVLKPAP